MVEDAFSRLIKRINEVSDMLAFLFCLAVGFSQTVLLSIVLKGAFAGDMKKAVIALLLKLAVYGTGFTVLYFFFLKSVIYAGAGFIAGVVASVIYVVLKAKKDSASEKIKGDESGEHGRAL